MAKYTVPRKVTEGPSSRNGPGRACGALALPALGLVSLALAPLLGTVNAAEAAQNRRGVDPMLQPPARFRPGEGAALAPGHEYDEVRVPAPPPDRRADDRFHGDPGWRSRAALTTLESCDPGNADVRSAPALVAFIQAASGYECLNLLFDGPEDLRRAAFRETNVLHVLETAGDLTLRYDGTNTGNLMELLYFIRAAYFNESYLDGIHLSENVDQATMDVLDEFIASPHFWTVTAEHSVVLGEVFVILDSLSHGYRIRYLPVVKEWLAAFDARHIVHWEFLTAANAAMVWWYRGHWDDDFLEVALEDGQIVEILSNLALADSLLDDPRLDDSDREFLELVMSNAARELARFLEYPSAGIAPAVQQALGSILDHYEPTGHGATIWMAVADHVFHNEKCDSYGICDAKDDIEKAVLSVEHSCGDHIHIRAQGMTPELLRRSCEDMAATEVFFFEKIGTNSRPLPGDRNDALEVIVYSDYDNYRTYSTFLFGNSTNNGGIYLEGEPSEEGNVPRFFAYLATWLEDVRVWNLEHEYVHYLDGRFNLVGAYWDYQVSTHKTIWWTEGLAEFISFLGCVSPALGEYLEGDILPLDEIFSILDYRDRTLYPKSHLATWFLFEKRGNDIERFLRFFRAGDYDGYLKYLDDAIGESYESDWRRWLASRVTS